MKLVFLYGPPAVGKLTVAQALGGLTGYKVLHNHLLSDLAEAVFAWGTPPFGELVRKLRFQVLELALQKNVSLISTFVYAAGQDDAQVQEIKAFVEAGGGQCVFVQLRCKPETLLERVEEESRRQFKKLGNVQVLERLLQEYELFQPVPFADSLQIDTDELSPAQAAQAIVAYMEETP
ncbi:MAG: AAA family ATPase [Meiothermus sp.]|nr:AAA family ATPase [Meiothermus sp.]